MDDEEGLNNIGRAEFSDQRIGPSREAVGKQWEMQRLSSTTIVGSITRATSTPSSSLPPPLMRLVISGKNVILFIFQEIG
jgi:hypothetical protein